MLGLAKDSKTLSGCYRLGSVSAQPTLPELCPPPELVYYRGLHWHSLKLCGFEFISTNIKNSSDKMNKTTAVEWIPSTCTYKKLFCLSQAKSPQYSINTRQRRSCQQFLQKAKLKNKNQSKQNQNLILGDIFAVQLSIESNQSKTSTLIFIFDRSAFRLISFRVLSDLIRPNSQVFIFLIFLA